MKNFIFKSADADLQKIVQLTFRQLDSIINEQIKQRMDLADIKRFLQVIMHEMDIQKQADAYYQQKLDETSPQTDIEDKRPPLGDLD